MASTMQHKGAEFRWVLSGLPKLGFIPVARELKCDLGSYTLAGVL